MTSKRNYKKFLKARHRCLAFLFFTHKNIHTHFLHLKILLKLWQKRSLSRKTNIPNLFGISVDNMIVILHIRIKMRSPIANINLLSQAKINKLLEIPIHRRKRDGRKFFLNLNKNPLSGRMIRRLRKKRENFQLLRSETKISFATSNRKVFKPIFVHFFGNHIFRSYFSSSRAFFHAPP